MNSWSGRNVFRRVLRLCQSLPMDPVGRAISYQLLRSGTSVGANYRSACRGRSKVEFRAKLGVVEEEADESAFWMELIIEGGLMEAAKVQALHDEADQLTRIMAASRRTAGRTDNRKPQIANRK
jgi:four helix bundle protein